MQSPQSEVKLTNPPKSETKLSKGEVKLTKIKANHPIMIGGQLIEKGMTAMATPEEVAEFCDKEFTLPYTFSGERYEGEYENKKITRAVRA